MLVAIPLGVAIGASLGLLGGGGSVLAVPVLVYVLGQSVHDATTASLVIVATGAVVGGLGHARGRRVCWAHAGVFALSTLPGVVAGTALGSMVESRSLLAAFAILMLLAAAMTWRRARATDLQGGAQTEPPCPRLILGRDVLAGVGVGVATGLFGVGGGFLIVPALVMLLALPMRRAVGTSLVIITVSSIVALIAHLAAGRAPDPVTTVSMTAACAVGALTGAALAGRVPQRHLGRGFAGVVAVLAAYLLVSTMLLGGPHHA